MNRDMPDELITEWVETGVQPGANWLAVDPTRVRKYAYGMHSGRVYLKRVLEWLKSATYTRLDVKTLVDPLLDWRLGELGIRKDEVVVIRVRAAGIVFGKEYPARETYPSTEEWGEFGWTYTSNSHRDPLAAKIARTIVVAKRRMWMRVRRGTV
jgi:hypothetical protein